MNESIFSKFRIPTLLGLSIIILGVAAGVYGTLRQQTLVSRASLNETPQNIVLTNISGESVTISWQTPSQAVGYVTFGKDSFDEQTALDDRDRDTTTKRRLHYVTLRNLAAETHYQFKVISGQASSQQPLEFTTAVVSSAQNGSPPVIGTVIEGDGFLENGTAYLSVDGMGDQSGLIGSFGNFIIPISLARQEDLNTIFIPQDDQIGTVKVISERGGIATATFSLKAATVPIGSLTIGSNINLETSTKGTPQPTPQLNQLKYDLNQDGKLNASDYAILLNNIGKNPKDKRADLNGDGVVDQKDLKLMQDEIELVNH